MRGHVQKVRDGVWKLYAYAGRTPDGRRKYVTRTVRGDRNFADDQMARLITEVRDGHHDYPPGTLGDLLDRWMRHANLAPATRIDYRSVADNHILPELGDVDVAKLRASDLDLLYARLAEKKVGVDEAGDDRTLGPARIRRVHNMLSAALGQAVRWREVAANVARDATPPTVPKADVVAPSEQQLLELLAACKSTDAAFYTYLRMAAATGARRSEVCGLRWGDVDFDGRSVTIRRSIVLVPGKILAEPTKSRRVRHIALDPGTLLELRGHRARTTVDYDVDDDSYIFHRLARPEIPWRPDMVSERFAEIRDEAGVTGIRLHDIRHFVATQLMADGNSPVDVAERIGHARPSTTMDMYGHARPATDREMADRLGRLLGGG